MELANDIYWVVPVKEIMEQLEDCQKDKFNKFLTRHSVAELENGELGLSKKDVDKFFWQFGYHFWDRLNEE